MEDKTEILLKKSLEFGAEKAKVIETSSITVGEWVRWKCIYGCPFYAQDGYHPPDTPNSESTRKVLAEYTRAILMNGPQGKSLTEAALRLEGEAFRMGFYKAFALTALPVGGGPG